MNTTMDPLNFTVIHQRDYRRSPHEHRRKFIWVIFAAGGFIIIFALSYIIYRYISKRIMRSGTSDSNRIRNRPLLSPPFRGTRHGTDESSSGYIIPGTGDRPLPSTPNRPFRGIRDRPDYITPDAGGPNTEPLIGADGYLRPYIPGNHYNTPFSVGGNTTPPILPSRDYENHEIVRQQSIVSPINLTGNIEQVTIVQGTASITIGSAQFGQNDDSSKI